MPVWFDGKTDRRKRERGGKGAAAVKQECVSSTGMIMSEANRDRHIRWCDEKSSLLDSTVETSQEQEEKKRGKNRWPSRGEKMNIENVKAKKKGEKQLT